MKRPRLAKSQVGTLAGIVVIVIAFAILGWHRRWIADDGLIVVRTVRNVLAGNGPVFNAFERAEANTSTLWTYVLVAVVGLLRTEPVITAVVVGWVFSVGGLALALDATRRFHRARGSTVMLVPAGAFILIGTQPFWDYATSGLETGICTLWMAAIWWLLVALRPESRARFVYLVAIVIGLGPLARPDFAVVSVVFSVALYLLVRPSRTQTIGLLAAALVLPVGYEIFRAGYYGVLVPLPAITKSAIHAEWERGFVYLVDYVRPYFVYVPMAILAIVAGMAVKKKWITDRAKILVGATTLSALLMAGFVLRVGGDFMHGRMLLPATFMIILPALVLPWHRITAPALVAIGLWAVAAVIIRSDGRAHATAFRVADERHNYATWTKTEHPTSADVFLAADGYSTNLIAKALANHDHRLISEGGLELAANPAYAQPVMYAVGRLGTGGATAPLDGIVIDVLGLANPLGAHISVNQPGMTGHEKSLPWAWIRADYIDPATDRQPQDKVTPSAIHAARHAMTCGDLAELLGSVREPMTSSRFWANLKGALHRTKLEVPSDPFEAEAKLCDADLTVHSIKASSSYELEGWGVLDVIDGARTSTKDSPGYSSLGPAPQWIELEWLAQRSISKVTLYPRTDLPGGGFPIDVAIQTWDGTKWVDRVTFDDLPNPGATAHAFSFPTERTQRLRIVGKKLSVVAGAEHLQFAEIEVE